MERQRIEARSGTAFEISKGQRFEVVDVEGCQVSDLLAFNAADVGEVISNGRTFDYQETIAIRKGHLLYSNRSNPMLEIVEDDVGRHDFLLTPCSKETFAMCYENEPEHRGCFGNLAAALEPYGVTEDMIPCAFNIFMNVPVDASGKLQVLPPTSKAGDRIVFEAKMDLVIGLTACSAPTSNGGTCTPIDWRKL
ncbi:urea carboxylase-associated family protein [Sphingomicrobium sp. XHP0235]|uniref:urea carboxylase-associated family protein n=1 Tax=Sphingomicrobium aquimarinum TaxID=3133971 RepID=UPI0031FEE5E0